MLWQRTTRCLRIKWQPTGFAKNKTHKGGNSFLPGLKGTPMKTLIAALSIATIATFSSVAFAQAPEFNTADVNADGVISMEEAKAALPDMDEAKIVAADANNDGGLSEAEYTVLIAS